MPSTSAEEAMRRAEALEDADNVDGAITAMSEAIELDAANPMYRALRGRLLSLQKRFRAAIRDFDSALALKPDAPTTLYGRARARSKIEDLDGAIEDYERCIALQPQSADAYEQIGDINYYRENLAQARASYRKALELDPIRFSHVRKKLQEVEQKLIEDLPE